jgi:hypothetical protein
MADPKEDYLTARLEEDRRGMAQQVSELKKDYDIPRRINASIKHYPWAWVGGAMLTGWLLPRLPARRKEVYDFKSRLEEENPREIRMVSDWEKKSEIGKGIWSFTQPILSAYLARQLYNRIAGARKSNSAP